MLLLPWERLLWSGRPAWPHGSRYTLTDFRVVASRDRGRARPRGAGSSCSTTSTMSRFARSALDRLLRTTTLTIRARDSRRRPLVLREIRRGPQVAAVLAAHRRSATAELDAEAMQGHPGVGSRAPFPPGQAHPRGRASRLPRSCSASSSAYRAKGRRGVSC